MKSPVYLNALRAFEASARHRSFAAAAVELHVTPAAVGQLVRTLEQWLGVALFHRANRGRVRLTATEAAERALPDIRAGFDRLALGVERLKEPSASGVLTVAVSPAFAAKWLLPRIDKFQAACPDMDVRLDTNLKPVDFVAQGVDIGVRYGAGSWPGLTAVKLMDEEVFPVCSPKLLSRRGRLQKPDALARETLIHDLSMDSHTGFPTWDMWLKEAGVTGVPTKRSMKINNSAAVLQAAIEGHGIALARSVMANDDLEAGRLIRLFPKTTFASPLAYYIVYRAECSSVPALVAFREWLLGETSDKARRCRPVRPKAR
jgi:LysR family glycine cleavage system transcriptional activator